MSKIDDELEEILGKIIETELENKEAGLTAS